MNHSPSDAINDKATLETVTGVQRWTDALLTFTTTRPDGYDFIPGQYSRLGLALNGGMLWRAYSITSAPDAGHLEYYGIIVPGGAFTTALKMIQPGDTIWIEKQRYGFMTTDRFADGRDLWMLATGTGLGPFLSILRDPAVWKQYRNLILVHCVRHAEEFAYRDELRALQEHPPEGATATLQLLTSATRDPKNRSAAFHDRITALLENGELEKAAGCTMNAEASRVMLCGNPDMIEDTRKILHQRGMRPCRRTLPGQFLTENYW